MNTSGLVKALGFHGETIARGKLIFQIDGWGQLVKKARQAGTPEGKSQSVRCNTLRLAKTFLERERGRKNERGFEKGRRFFGRQSREKA